MNRAKYLLVAGQAIGFFVLVKLCSLIKTSFIVGSTMALFSGTNAVLPLSGAFGGLSNASLVFILGALLRTLLFGFNPFKLLAFHIPGFCASLYWVYKNWVFSVLLPLVCMILFIMHPVGGQAFLYSFFWLIPVGLYFVKRKTIFLQALASTFIAHAVGSAIWVYAMPMTPQIWYSLIPVVIVERLLFASGMVIIYNGLYLLSQWLQTSVTKRKANSIFKKVA